MKTNSKQLIVKALSVALVLQNPLQAMASLSVQNFSPATNSTYTMTEDASLFVAPQDNLWTGRRLFFSAMYNWVDRPLVELNADRTQRLDTIVSQIHTLDITAGLAITQRFSLNAVLPLNLTSVYGNTNQFALGDARLIGKWRLTPDWAWVHVAVIPEFTAPTGAQDLFLSSGGVGAAMRVAVERDFGPVVASANVGYRYRANAVFSDLNYTHTIPMALGLFVPVGKVFGINAEASGSMLVPLNRFNNPGEVYLGARIQPSREFVATLGAAVGAVGGVGSNDIRVIAGLKFSPIPGETLPIALPTVQAAPIVVDPKVEIRKQVIFTAKEIQLGQEVKFEHNKAVLTASGKELLDAVAEVLIENKGQYKSIVVEGHTNEIGSQKFNLKLSRARAKAVKEYLISRGIGKDVLKTEGFGKMRPKALPGLSREAQLEANRRVEFKVIQDAKKGAKKAKEDAQAKANAPIAPATATTN